MSEKKICSAGCQHTIADENLLLITIAQMFRNKLYKNKNINLQMWHIGKVVPNNLQLN